MFTNDNTGSGGLAASDDATLAFLDDLHVAQVAPPAPEAPVAPPAAPAARAPEKVQIAQPMAALAQAQGAGPGPVDQVEVPQIIQAGGGDVRITRFAGSETIAMRGGPSVTFMANGGYETDQPVRVTPLGGGLNNFGGGKGGRMPGDFNPRTEYRFAGGQWVVADAQGPVQFFDGRNEYVLVPDNNGVRNRVAILQR